MLVLQGRRWNLVRLDSPAERGLPERGICSLIRLAVRVLDPVQNIGASHVGRSGSAWNPQASDRTAGPAWMDAEKAAPPGKDPGADADTPAMAQEWGAALVDDLTIWISDR